MKRLLAMILSFAMILVVVMTAGCDGDNETTGTSGSSETTGTGSSETTDTAENTSDTGSSVETSGSSDTSESTGIDWDTVDPFQKPYGFEDVDFGGTTFVIAAYIGGDGWESNKEIYSDGTDVVSVAVRQRNDVMAELYNCTIVLNESESPATLAAADVTGNQHTIDMFAQKYNLGTLAVNGYQYNLYTLGIDFENPWWDQKYVSTYSLKDSNGNLNLYSVIGDWAISCFEAAHAIVYNKTVYDNAGIKDDIYQLVRDKKWTMDKFAEMIKLGVKEVSGNSEYHASEGDIMGWVRTGHATHGLHVASGLSIVDTIDGNLVFSMTENTTAWSDTLDKAISIWSMPETETLGYTAVREAVQSGNTLFASEVLAVLEAMKDADVSVGLVPYPLYSESQENYAHYADNHLMPYAVPVSVPDLEVMGDFMEVFGFHSRYIVRTAWIEAYSYEYCDDADSAEMLNLILDSRTYDPGYLFWNYEGEISNMISNGKNQVVKFTERYASTAAETISTFIESMTKANTK